MKAKKIFTFDPRAAKIRLIRIIWQRSATEKRRSFSAFFSVSLQPTIYQFTRQPNDWRLILLGVGLHYNRSYGGIHC